ncbi:MAG: cupin domain-containing protein [Clostridiaceae bacterium]
MKVYRPSESEGTIQYGGVVRQALCAGSSAQLSCGTLTLQPGESMKEIEKHQSDEIFFIASGELKIAGEDKSSILAKAGEIVHLPMGEWHLSSNPGSTPTVLFWVNRD